MKFGFDIDGTLTAAPRQLGAIMRALQAAGHEVHVITGQTTLVDDASRQRRIARLDALGVGDAYDRLFLAGPPDWVADKHDYCQRERITLMFEDSPVYAEAIRPVCPVLLLTA